MKRMLIGVAMVVGVLSGTAAWPVTVTLNWVDGCLNETSMIVEKSTDGVTWFLAANNAPNTTTATVTGVLQDTDYRVKCINGAQSSPYTNTWRATVPFSGQPSNLTGTIQ